MNIYIFFVSDRINVLERRQLSPLSYNTLWYIYLYIYKLDIKKKIAKIALSKYTALVL